MPWSAVNSSEVLNLPIRRGKGDPSVFKTLVNDYLISFVNQTFPTGEMEREGGLVCLQNIGQRLLHLICESNFSHRGKVWTGVMLAVMASLSHVHSLCVRVYVCITRVLLCVVLSIMQNSLMVVCMRQLAHLHTNMRDHMGVRKQAIWFVSTHLVITRK